MRHVDVVEPDAHSRHVATLWSGIDDGRGHFRPARGDRIDIVRKLDERSLIPVWRRDDASPMRLQDLAFNVDVPPRVVRHQNRSFNTHRRYASQAKRAEQGSGLRGHSRGTPSVTFSVTSIPPRFTTTSICWPAEYFRSARSKSSSPVIA